MIMKKFTKFLFIAMFIGGIFSTSAFAQDGEEITDNDLWKYALLQEVVEQMKKDISVELNSLIKSQEGMTGKRYKELASTKGDEAKLAEIEAQDWEVKFLEMTNQLKDDRTAAIKTVNQELATKMVGDNGKTYKAIKSALKSDDALKTKYSEIVSAIRMENIEKADD